jgi:aspartate aminotransferase
MSEISNRMGSLGTENAFIVLQEVKQLESHGQKVLNFCIGQPDFSTPEHICAAARTAIDSGKHGYTPSNGVMPLRQAIAKRFSETREISVDANDVVVACGGKPFIWYSIFALTDAGQGHEVIYPNPGFPIYQSMIRAMGAVPVPLYLREKNNLNFSIDELRKILTPNTRLLILNSPHNPTGSVLSMDELEQVAELCVEHDLWVYSDEVYSALTFDMPFSSIASIPGMYDRTIIVDCASKTYAMTGWRLGYMANKTLAPHITRLVTNSDSCAPAISQEAVLHALSADQQAVEYMAATYKKRRDLFLNGFSSIPGISCHKPGGAFYLWPNVTEACRITGCADSEIFRKRLLNEHFVACLADIHFGARVPGEGQHVRFSCASSTRDIQEGLEQLDTFVRKHM